MSSSNDKARSDDNKKMIVNNNSRTGAITMTTACHCDATVAMEKGLRFAIREGGRTVGAGQVTEILD